MAVGLSATAPLARSEDGRPGLAADLSLIQKAVRQAVLAAGISKPATCHSLRHSCATHLLVHKDVNTTMIYTNVLNRGPWGWSALLTRSKAVQAISCH